MDSITDLGGLLRYGAIGLGLALSVLAFLLLRTEQKQTKPRRQILTAVYVFMSFSLLLSVGGFVSEYVRSQAGGAAEQRTIEELKAEVKAKTEELKKATDDRSEIAASRKVLFGLLEAKEGKLKRLAELKPDSPDYPTVVQEIRDSLQGLDDLLRKVLYPDAR